MTQAELDTLYKNVEYDIDNYNKGMVTVVEFIQIMATRYMQMDDRSLVGLVDPSMGLPYPKYPDL